YEATLKRQEICKAHGLSHYEVNILLRMWAKVCEPVSLHFLWRPQLRDPGDEMVLETAINGGAQAIVTFNTIDFRQACPRFGVDLWTPATLLGRLRRRS
ncbi:MAG: PIN domain-containing protein, partial [Gammaproteobacteria bacterium]